MNYEEPQLCNLVAPDPASVFLLSSNTETNGKKEEFKKSTHKSANSSLVISKPPINRLGRAQSSSRFNKSPTSPSIMPPSMSTFAQSKSIQEWWLASSGEATIAVVTAASFAFGTGRIVDSAANSGSSAGGVVWRADLFI